MGIDVSVLVSGVPMDEYEKGLLQLYCYCGMCVQGIFAGWLEFGTKCLRFGQLPMFRWIGNVTRGGKFSLGGVSQR